MKLFAALVLVVTLTGCAGRSLHIESTAPVVVESNGVTVCDSTPCDLAVACYTYSNVVVLTAAPTGKGYTQRKVISPCTLPRGVSKVRFDPLLAPVAPVQVEMNLNEQARVPSGAVSK